MRIIATVGLFGLVGCGEELFTISVEQTSDTVVTGVGVLPPEAPDEPLAIDQWVEVPDQDYLAGQGIAESDVTDAYLRQLTVSVVSPDSQDLSFLDEVELWVSAPGLPDARIAHGGPYPAGTMSADLELDGVDIAPYAFADGPSIGTIAGGQPPEADTTLRATASFEVGVSTNSIVSRLGAM